MAMRRNGILSLENGGDAFLKRYDWPGEEIGAVRPYIESLPGLAPTPVDERLARSQEMGRLQLGLALAARGFGSMGAQPRAGEMAISTVGRELLAPLAGDAMTVAQKLYDDKLALQAAFKAEQGKVSLAALDMARDRQNKLAAFEETKKIAEIKASTTGLLSTFEEGVDFTVKGPDGTELTATGNVTTTRNKTGDFQYAVTFGDSVTPDGIVIAAGTRVISFKKPPTGESGSRYFAPRDLQVKITRDTVDILANTDYAIDPRFIGREATYSLLQPKSGAAPIPSLIIGNQTIPLSELTLSKQDRLNLTQPWSDPVGKDHPNSISWQRTAIGALASVQDSIVGPGAVVNENGLKVIPGNISQFLKGDLWYRDLDQVREFFPLERNDDIPLEPEDQDFIIEQLRANINSRKEGQEKINKLMNKDHVDAAIKELLGKTVTNLGLPSRLETEMDRPQEGAAQLRLKAAVKSYDDGANPDKVFSALHRSGFVPYEQFFKTSPGKAYAVWQWNPEIAGADDINDTAGVQRRIDAGVGAQNIVINPGDPVLDRSQALNASAMKVRERRLDKQSHKDASDIQDSLSQAIGMRSLLLNFETAVMLSPEAEGWLTGRFASGLTQLGLSDMPEWSAALAASRGLQEAYARQVGKKGLGEMRITDQDLKGLQLLQAKLANPEQLNKAVIQQMMTMNDRIIQELVRSAGYVDFDEKLLREVAETGLDTSKMRTHLNWHSPYFRSTFPLSRQQAPQHSPEYMKALKQLGDLKSLADNKGNFWQPTEASTKRGLAKGNRASLDEGKFVRYPVFHLDTLFRDKNYDALDKLHKQTTEWYRTHELRTFSR
jgi:hypothetical protein